MRGFLSAPVRDVLPLGCSPQDRAANRPRRSRPEPPCGAAAASPCRRVHSGQRPPSLEDRTPAGTARAAAARLPF
ncbi:hypothetical protein ACP26L_24505 [Paenibacillus sp. S-38]|uniref:hypothetical protein n=1 Tax=Paenibacillus sp. S-38 TaxID=3416710 RepID=UPI003CEB66E7